MGKRVLITGLATFWGGLAAKALEADPGVDVIIGLDTREPTIELERTEYVRTDENYSILSRIVKATGVDTIAHTFGIREIGADTLEADVRAYLCNKQTLLVLDNFEQVVAAAPMVARLLQG